MVTGAVGCIALGRMYQLVKMATGGRIEGEFQLGILGVLGCMMFFFSANFGLMDKIADDGSTELRKYRLAAFAAPALSLAIFLSWICFSDVVPPIEIPAGVATAFIMSASYFNLKHFLLPDVNCGYTDHYNPLAKGSVKKSFALCKARAEAPGLACRL